MTELVNFYEHKNMKKHLKKTHNPNFDKHNIKIPMRMIICGSSGTGKTSTLLNIIRQMDNTFDKIHIVTKAKDEPLYNFLEEQTGGTKGGVFIKEFDKDGLPNLDEFNKEQNNLIVLDDLVNQSEKEQRPIGDFFIRGRKKNCSIIYLTQSWYGVPKLIRTNINYVILKSIPNQRNLVALMKDCSLGASKKELLEMYKIAQEDFNSFLLFDLDNPKRPYRLNFDKYFDEVAVV